MSQRTFSITITDENKDSILGEEFPLFDVEGGVQLVFEVRLTIVSLTSPVSRAQISVEVGVDEVPGLLVDTERQVGGIAYFVPELPLTTYNPTAAAEIASVQTQQSPFHVGARGGLLKLKIYTPDVAIDATSFEFRFDIALRLAEVA